MRLSWSLIININTLFSMKQYSFFEIAILTLLSEKKPMSARGIWESAITSGLADKRKGQE